MAVTIKKKRDRSPSYPFIPLGAAIKRLEELEDTFKRHPAPANKAGLAWGMKEKSSQAFQTLAALKSYGLVRYDGSGDERVASLTEDALTYLRAQQPSIKTAVLQRCALQPKAIAEYWKVWGKDRPPTPVCKDHLVLKGKFSDSAADTFIKVYDQTISFAGLSDQHGDDTDTNSADESADLPEVGDLVQWESGGVPQFSEPRRVRAVQEDGDEVWIFVEGSETGISSEEVSIESKPEVADPGKSKTPPTLPLHGGNPQGTAHLLHDCEREAMRGPLSADMRSSYRLLVRGDLGPKELGRLIRILKAQQAILSDDDHFDEEPE